MNELRGHRAGRGELESQAAPFKPQNEVVVSCFSSIRPELRLIPLCADNREKSPAMPGSPVDAKTHSRSAPSSLASSTMPPLPSVNPSGPRPASFSTTACKGHIDFFVAHECGAHVWAFFLYVESASIFRFCPLK